MSKYGSNWKPLPPPTGRQVLGQTLFGFAVLAVPFLLLGFVIVTYGGFAALASAALFGVGLWLGPHVVEAYWDGKSAVIMARAKKLAAES